MDHKALCCHNGNNKNIHVHFTWWLLAGHDRCSIKLWPTYHKKYRVLVKQHPCLLMCGGLCTLLRSIPRIVAVYTDMHVMLRG